MRKKTFLLSALATISMWSYAQTSYLDFDQDKDFRKAKYLYLTETYRAAQDKFDKVLDNSSASKDTKESAEFYASLVALINNERGAEERFLAFQVDYPNSIYVRDGSWELGSYYLRNADYDKAYQYFQMGNLNDLPERKRQEYQFKLGYVHVMRGNENQGLRQLEPLTRSGEYQDEASFYVGYIYYSKRDYEKAFGYFDNLRNRNSVYESKVLPYMVQIEFNNEQYEKAIEDGKTLLRQNNDGFIQSEVSKIIGESYFKLNKFDDAIPYLEAYTGEKTNVEYYQLGYAYYQKGDFQTAISMFNKIIGEKNPLSQTAYYQLGNAYLQSEQKRQALTAFKSASEMDFNSEIQEDANYNYAKLSYEIGNPFIGTPEVIQNFIQKYPQSNYISEINEYLIDSYISSGNYKNALEVLSQISNKNTNQNAAEQQASFLHGTNLVKEGKISEAERFFSKAANSNSNATIKARALFWQGETNYRQNKYENALSNFKSFKVLNENVPETKEIDYQLGYTYLKLRQYQNAAQSFETYIATNPPGEFKSDAKMRLADSYIGTRETPKALNLYQQVAEQSAAHSDEAAFNHAVVLGILGENEQKINALENFTRNYPLSQYYENARLELAEAYLRKGENDKAMDQLDDVIKNGKSEMAARAKLRKGLVFYNQQKNNQALTEFRAVAQDYPGTQLGLQAIEDAKRIYIEENNLREFERWANSLDYYTVDQSELENLAYQSAKKTFDEKNYSNAIAQFTSFVNQYPQSGYANAANYNLGESYYLTENYSAAEEPLLLVAASNNEFQEDALLRLSQIFLRDNQETKALLTLENLNQITRNSAYKTFSEIHLMRLYSAKDQNQNAVKMANLVLSNPKNESSVLQEAELTLARSYFNSNQSNLAKEAYAKLEQAASSAVKAEALYYKAWFLNKDKNYTESNEVVFGLASRYSEQQYWGSKALVVMADNYFNMDDLYQANATLDAVIENYQHFGDVIQEAQNLKNKIKR